MKEMQYYYRGKRDAFRLIGNELTDILTKTKGNYDMLKRFVEMITDFCNEATDHYNESMRELEAGEDNDLSK